MPSALAGLADKILLIGKYQRILGKDFSLPVQLSPSQDCRRLAALIDERLALVDQQILVRINAEQRLLKSLKYHSGASHRGSGTPLIGPILSDLI